MIEHWKALEIIFSNVSTVETEKVYLKDAANRFLAEDIVSQIEMPPFDKSAVDGYACRKDDLPFQLKVVETVAAGQIPTKKIEPKTCIKIMTGAPLPEGADIVIMIEDTKQIDSETIKFIGSSKATNICLRGEDIQKEQTLLKAGTFLKPWHSGIIASVGKFDVNCYRKVRVALLITGDELLEPFQEYEFPKIYNSNAYVLISLCQALPIDIHYYGILPDKPQVLSEKLNEALQHHDIVLFTGGVSMGDFDYVPLIFREHNLRILFDSIAIQPGRPLTYATNGKVHCFGLPGNPVSSMLQFELTVKYLIYWLSNSSYQPVEIPLKLVKTIERKKADRTSYYPVRLTDQGCVEPIHYHGSAHLNAYTDAFGVISLTPGQFSIGKDEYVFVRQIW